VRLRGVMMMSWGFDDDLFSALSKMNWGIDDELFSALSNNFTG
jgi:hypothetical protein